MAFRNRRRFELKLEAQASRTLRKYGFCEEDVWTEEEKAIAEKLGFRLVDHRMELYGVSLSRKE